MEKRFYYLDVCSTCHRIMRELSIDDSWTLREIRSEPLKAEELDEMADRSGSYEGLLNRRSRKYRALGLHERYLSESDCRRYILAEDTLLKRPIIAIGDEIYVGPAKKLLEAVRARLDD